MYVCMLCVAVHVCVFVHVCSAVFVLTWSFIIIYLCDDIHADRGLHIVQVYYLPHVTCIPVRIHVYEHVHAVFLKP